MDKPDDVSQEIWNMCWWAQPAGLQIAASRAIMAARLQERDDIAALVDSVGKGLPTYQEANLARGIAQAIRARK